MKKGVLISIIIILMIVLTSCGVKAPNEEILMDLLPTEILQYELDGVIYISEISDLQILKQKTEDDYDITDCKITLEDDNLVRIAYVNLQSSYWDKGGWILDKYDILSAEEFTPKTVIDKERVLSLIDSVGYTEYIENYYEESSGFSYGSYSINEKHRYVTVSGDIIAEAELIALESWHYPTIYLWDIALDDSTVQYDWDIIGTWYGETYDENYKTFSGYIPENIEDHDDDDYRVTLEIHELLQEDPFSGEYIYDAIVGYKGSDYVYEHSNTHPWKIEGTGISDISFNLYFYGGYPGFSVSVYPDTAFIINQWGTFFTDVAEMISATCIEKVS